MNYTDAEDLIYTTFNTGWADETYIVFPNMEKKTDGLEEWVRLTVQYSSSIEPFFRGGGVTGKRYFGIVAINIFNKVYSGSARRRELVQKVFNTLEKKELNNQVILGPGYSEHIGIIESWDEWIVKIPFRYDNIV